MQTIDPAVAPASDPAPDAAKPAAPMTPDELRAAYIASVVAAKNANDSIQAAQDKAARDFEAARLAAEDQIRRETFDAEQAVKERSHALATQTPQGVPYLSGCI